jgi:hypothetical protein
MTGSQQMGMGPMIGNGLVLAVVLILVMVLVHQHSD